MLTREQILARKTGRGVVTLDDGSELAIRALTRNEVLALNEIDDVGEKDNFVIAHGVTEPKLTIEDVAAWAEAGDAGDLHAVSEGIATISGLKEGADKKAYQTFREGA